MMAQVWLFERTILDKKIQAIGCILRAGFCPSHAEIVKRFQNANKRTALHIFFAALLAIILLVFSTLQPATIIAATLALMAVDVGVYVMRRRIIVNPPSRWDIPLFISINIVLCTAWVAMPTVLEFRTPVERVAGLMILISSLLSAMVVAAQVPVWLINLMITGSALLAPDVASLFRHQPHTGACGVIVIKLLFFYNLSTLALGWHDSAKREADMQAELDLRRRQAEDLAAAKAMFLAHMSHEIRSPLAGVTLLASVLKRLEGVPEDQRQMIEQIDAGGQAILNLLNAVLDYSKIEAGKVRLLPAPVNPAALLEGVTGFFAQAAGDAHIRLSLSIDGPMPATLTLDETRTRQIVTSLVGNAIKHGRGATICLNAAYTNGALQVEVADNGKGVDADVKAHLFTPYEQQAGADTGTGLSLAISRGLVNLMGGEIGFRETQGGGATFWFRIPASPSMAELG